MVGWICVIVYGALAIWMVVAEVHRQRADAKEAAALAKLKSEAEPVEEDPDWAAKNLKE